VIKKLITKCSTLYLRSWRLRPRACGFACVIVLARTSEGLAELTVLIGVAAPNDLAGSILVKILYAVMARTSSKWLEPRNNSLMFVIAYLFLFTHLCLDILHPHIIQCLI